MVPVRSLMQSLGDAAASGKNLGRLLMGRRCELAIGETGTAAPVTRNTGSACEVAETMWSTVQIECVESYAMHARTHHIRIYTHTHMHSTRRHIQTHFYMTSAPKNHC